MRGAGACTAYLSSSRSRHRHLCLQTKQCPTPVSIRAIFSCEWMSWRPVLGSASRLSLACLLFGRTDTWQSLHPSNAPGEYLSWLALKQGNHWKKQHQRMWMLGGVVGWSCPPLNSSSSKHPWKKASCHKISAAKMRMQRPRCLGKVRHAFIRVPLIFPTRSGMQLCRLALAVFTPDLHAARRHS